MARKVPRDPVRARIETEVFDQVRDVLVRSFPYYQERLEGRDIEQVLTEQDHIFVKKLIEVVWESRELFPDHFQGAEGRLVRDKTEPIAPCHQSYEETVIGMYLLACFRRYMSRLHARWQREEMRRRKAEEAERKKGLLDRFRKKQDEGEPINERLAKLYPIMKPYLRYEWQFDLIPAYARLTPEVVEALGEDLLTLRTEEAVAEAAEFQAKDITHAREVAGENFAALLTNAPSAVQAMRTMKPAETKRLISDLLHLVGSRAWLVIGDREKFQYAMHLRYKNKSDFVAVAPFLPEVAQETVDALREAFSARRLGMFLEIAKDTMGEKFPEAFGDPRNMQTVHVFINKTKEISMNDHYENEEDERRDFANSFSVLCRSYMRDPQSFMAIKTMS